MVLEIVVCYSLIIFIHDKIGIVSFFYGIFWLILLFCVNFIILTSSFILFRKFYFNQSFLEINNQIIILQKLDRWGQEEPFSVNLSEIISVEANFEKTYQTQ